MRAARFYGRGDIRVDDIPEPVVKPGQVGIDVAWCGICGTDLHEYLDGPIFCPAPDKPNPITGEVPPVTLGHEMSGVVNSLGEGVTDLKVGDHVVVEPYIVPKGADTGPGSHYNLIEGSNFIGLGGNGGGMGEKIAVDRRWVHKIPDSLPLDQAALCEPLSVACHAVDKANVKAGQTALVIGCGPIGLLTAAVLKARGLTVIVSEPSSLRRQKALDLNVADHFIDPINENAAAKVAELTGGVGVDCGFECSSVQAGFDALLDAVRPAGTIVIVAIWGHPISFDSIKAILKELNIVGTIGYCNTHPDAIKLAASGKIDLKSCITAKIGLDDLVSKGFDTLINHNETAVKILVSPSGKGL